MSDPTSRMGSPETVRLRNPQSWPPSGMHEEHRVVFSRESEPVIVGDAERPMDSATSGMPGIEEVELNADPTEARDRNGNGEGQNAYPTEARDGNGNGEGQNERERPPLPNEETLHVLTSRSDPAHTREDGYGQVPEAYQEPVGFNRRGFRGGPSVGVPWDDVPVGMYDAAADPYEGANSDDSNGSRIRDQLLSPEERRRKRMVAGERERRTLNVIRFMKSDHTGGPSKTLPPRIRAKFIFGRNVRDRKGENIHVMAQGAPVHRYVRRPFT
ncbi:hypothetical protein BT69DRAFT_401217 [Atractiella rhizophila]|nr:hypothetical protein BT69DRAFT_401217 [Atractiella rhizophila]